MSSGSVTGGAAGFRGSQKKRRSNAQYARDLRRAAENLSRSTDGARSARRGSWDAGGQSRFLAEYQEDRLKELHAEKRVLRREVYGLEPDLEGSPSLPGRRV